MEIHFGGSAVILLWRSYRHQAITIDSSMPTDAFPVLLFLVMGEYDGNIPFSLFLQNLFRIKWTESRSVDTSASYLAYQRGIGNDVCP